jgi:hypothetical protein
MKTILFLLLALWPISAQTIYWRSGAPSPATVIGVTYDGGNHAIVQTAAAHSLSVGDVVLVGGVCTGIALDPAAGQSPVNGIRKVIANGANDSTHFAIGTNPAGTPIVGNGPFVTCDYLGGLDSQTAKFAAKLTAFSLGAGPLGWFDGATGSRVRQLALGTQNGLTSLVVSSNVATVTTSYPHGMVLGDGSKVAVYGAGSGSSAVALTTGNGAGAGHGYTVTVVDATHYTFPTVGVANGTYTGVNNACGPAAIPNDTIGGAQDCLRISQLAYAGNPIWDTVIPAWNPSGPNGYKFVEDGGPLLDVGTDYNWGFIYGLNALRFMIDPSDQLQFSIVMYALNHVERTMGVSWLMNTESDQGGNTNMTGYPETLAGWAMVYAIGKPYLSAAHDQTFRDKLFNDVNDPAAIASSLNEDFAQDNHNKVLAHGAAQAGDATHITLASSDSQADGYYVNNIIQIGGGAPGFVLWAYYTGGVTAVGAAGQTCLVNSFNGGGTSALGILTLTGPNAIANGTRIRLLSPGDSSHPYTSVPTTAAVSAGPSGGTATSCTGTANVEVGLGKLGLAIPYFGLVTNYVASTKVATVTGWKTDVGTLGAISPGAGSAYKIYATISISSNTVGGAATITGYNTQFSTDANLALRVAQGDAILAGNSWFVAGASAMPEVAESFITSTVVSDTSLSVTNGNTAATSTPQIAWMVHAWQPGDAGWIWAHKHALGAVGASTVLYPPSGGARAGYGYGGIADSGNNSIALGYTYALWGVVAASDPRAVWIGAVGQTLLFDYEILPYMNYSAGIPHSGSAYSFGVDMELGLGLRIMRNSVPSFPSMDEQGHWLTDMALFKLFDVLPDLKTEAGTGLVAIPAAFGTESSEQQLAGSAKVMYYSLDPALNFNPTSNAAKYLKYFEINTTYNMYSGFSFNVNYQNGVYLLNQDPRIVPVDFSTQPKQYAFTSSGHATCVSLGCPYSAAYRGDVVISRTGWGPARSATHLFFGSRTFANDHDVPENGSLRVYKVGNLLGIDAVSNLITGSANDETVMGDMMQFGGSGATVKLGSSNILSGVVQNGYSPITRWASANHGSWDPNYGDQNSNYAYFCSDLSGAYTNPINYAQRCIVHFKKPGTEEIILQWDSADVTGNPTQIATHVHYLQTGKGAFTHYTYPEGLTTCPGSGGCPSLNTNRAIQSLESGAAADADPARSFGVLTKFFSPGTITVNDDSLPVTISSVTPGNPTVFHAAANGLSPSANITAIVTGTTTRITTDAPIGLTAPPGLGQYVQVGGLASCLDPGGNNINQYFGSGSLAYTSPVMIDPLNFTINFNSSLCGSLSSSGGVAQRFLKTSITIVQASGDWAALNTVTQNPVVPTFIDGNTFSLPVNSSAFSGSFNGVVNRVYEGGNGISHRVTICGGNPCFTPVNTFESLIVHKITTIPDTTLTATAINPDANWTGVQTADKVALFARGGVTHATMGGFTTTHAGTAQYLFGGLTPGTYTVTINGIAATGSPFTVSANDNSIEFESTAGAVSINGSVLVGGLSSTTISGQTTASGNVIIH